MGEAAAGVALAASIGSMGMKAAGIGMGISGSESAASGYNTASDFMERASRYQFNAADIQERSALFYDEAADFQDRAAGYQDEAATILGGVAEKQIAASRYRAGGQLAAAAGTKAANDFQAGKLDVSAKFGEMNAALTDVTMRENLNATLGNIEAIRSASRVDPGGATGAALAGRASKVADRQRGAALLSINAQVEEDKKSADYLRSAGQFALLTGNLAAQSELEMGEAAAMGTRAAVEGQKAQAEATRATAKGTRATGMGVRATAEGTRATGYSTLGQAASLTAQAKATRSKGYADAFSGAGDIFGMLAKMKTT